MKSIVSDRSSARTRAVLRLLQLLPHSQFDPRDAHHGSQDHGSGVGLGRASRIAEVASASLAFFLAALRAARAATCWLLRFAPSLRSICVESCIVGLRGFMVLFCHIPQRTFQAVPTIRVTPAMQAGISDHVWDLAESVA